MSKVDIPDIKSQFASTNALNTRFQTIEDTLNDKVLFRDNPVGEPNTMVNDLDMGNQDIINVKMISAEDFIVAGEDITTGVQQAAQEANQARDEAQSFATDAENSATASEASNLASAASAAASETSRLASEAAKDVSIAARDQAQVILDSVVTTGDAQVARVTAEGTNQVGIVQTTGTTEVGKVTTEGTTQVNRVIAEGDTQEGRVTNEGNTQVTRVIGEGDTQVARVTAEGDKITAPFIMPTVEPTYALDASVGTLVETINRPTLQSAKAPDGRVWYSAVDTLPSSWKDDSYGFDIFDATTNYLKYSEAFDQTGSWLRDKVVMNPNTIKAPTLEMTGYKIIEDTATGTHGMYQIDMDTAPSTYYNYSVFFKAGERSKVNLNIWTVDSPTYAYAGFDLANGTVMFSSGAAENVEIEEFIDNWYRCSFTFVTGAVDINHHAGFYLYNGTSTEYTGDGTSGLYAFGAMVHNGYTKRPYFPSYDTWGTVQKTYTLASYFHTINKVEGTFVVEYEHQNIGFYNGFLFAMGLWPSAALYGVANQDKVKISSVADSNISTAEVTVANGKVKIACSYSDQKIAIAANGGSPTVITNPYFANVNWTSLAIGCNSWNALEQLNNKIYSVTYYPKQVTETELTALSTQ